MFNRVVINNDSGQSVIKSAPVYPIIAAVILGAATGYFFPQLAVNIKFTGTIFLNLLFMLVVPLLVCSMIMGVNGLGDIRHLGSIGIITLLLYISTTIIAVVSAIFFGLLINPGKSATIPRSDFPEISYEIVQTPLSGGSVLIFPQNQLPANYSINSKNHRIFVIDQNLYGVIDQDSKIVPGEIPISKWFDKDGHKAEPSLSGKGIAFKSQVSKLTSGEIIENFVPRNIFRSMAEENVFPLIMFSLFFGAVLSTTGGVGKPVIAVIHGLNVALLKCVDLLMYIAPLGVFGLVAGSIGNAELSSAGGFAAEFVRVARYGGTVIIGTLFHGYVTMMIILFLFARRNPFTYLKNMIPQALTAFSTDSSMATLPVSLTLSIEKNKISERIANFVLPIGATINMDGTAFYEMIASIFIAQTYGIHLGITEYLILIFTTTLGSIGTAGIPSASLITLIVVLRSVGLPAEGLGLILSIDWLMDRFRTTINVWGDVVVAAIVDRIDRKGYKTT